MENTQQRYLCAGLFSTGKLYIYRSVIMEVNLKSPQISAHKDNRVSFSLLFCVRHEKRTGKLSVRQQSIYYAKTQETHSRGNTTSALFPCCFCGNQNVVAIDWCINHRVGWQNEFNCFGKRNNLEFFLLNWEKTYFCIGNGAEIRLQNGVIESPEFVK